MDSKEFSQIRRTLGKTQKQLAQLLCVSTKAIQSFEQGWRKIPAHIGREMLLLMMLKTYKNRSIKPCWDTLNCPDEWRNKCIVWEVKAGHFCWFFNGTYCQGKISKSWEDKMKLCSKCEVYSMHLSKKQYK